LVILPGKPFPDRLLGPPLGLITEQTRAIDELDCAPFGKKIAVKRLNRPLLVLFPSMPCVELSIGICQLVAALHSLLEKQAMEVERERTLRCA
jgi:hypothetical protein